MHFLTSFLLVLVFIFSELTVVSSFCVLFFLLFLLLRVLLKIPQFQANLECVNIFSTF